MMFGNLGDRWGAESSPTGFDLVYAQNAEAVAPGIVEYVNTLRTAGESFIDALNRARMSVSMTNAQRELLDVQIQRARAGLPPLQMTAPAGLVITPQMMILIAVALTVLYLSTRRT